MLDAGQRAGILAGPHPVRHQHADRRGVGAERTTLHDGISGFEVEVGVGRQHPIDAQVERLACRGPGRLENGAQVIKCGECGGRWELGEPRKLLTRPALQIRGDEQRPAGALPQVRGQRAHHLRLPAEEDEPPRPESKRGRDGLGFMVEPGVVAPPERGKDQATVHQGGVTEPSTRAPRAPVAAGRLPGWPCSVR